MSQFQHSFTHFRPSSQVQQLINHKGTMTPTSNGFQDVEYTSLDHKTPYRRRWSILSFVLGSATSIVVAAILLSTYSLLTSPPVTTTEELEAQDWNHCGRSSNAAMARGCVLEPMIYGWMPPQCVYRELSDSFPVLNDRMYWTDQNKTREITRDELWAGKYTTIWTDR
jgi:hypothetical protein